MKLTIVQKQFLNQLQKEDRTKKTIQNYNFYLTRFGKWAGDIEVSQITPEKIQKFSGWLEKIKDEAGRTLKKNTINYHLIALRALINFLTGTGMKIKSTEIKLSKMPRRRLAIILDEDLVKMLQSPLKDCVIPRLTKEKRSLLQLRDKAILELLFATGMKVSELVNLRRDNLTEKNGRMKIMIKKKSGERKITLKNEVAQWLRKYLTVRRDNKSALFIRLDKAVNFKTTPASLSPRSIERLLEKYTKSAGLSQKITPEIIRQTFAQKLLKNNNDLKTVQNILGHASIVTTQAYQRLARNID